MEECIILSMSRNPLRKHQGPRSILKNSGVQEKNLQELIQASKLSLLGQLAAGIAHELRNPLAVLRLECDEITREIGCMAPEGRPACSTHCDVVKRNIGKMLDIVERIRSMSANPTAGFCKLDIHEVLKEAEQWTEHLVKPAQIQFSIDARASDSAFFGNKTQMEEVFLNLIRNACDSIRSSGQGSYIRVLTNSVGGRILVDVEDDGPGIHPKDLPRVFDPFFTTKPEGEGVGLGLSIVAQIVKEHGGSVRVDSQLGKGACFHVSLPHDRRREARERRP